MPELTEPTNELERPRGFGGTPDPEPATNEDGEEIATPEEQADYELLAVRGRKLVFGDGQDQILELMGSSETPAQGLGKAASMIMKSLVESAKESGREIDGGVVINAGAEIVQDLNDLAKAKGVYQYDTPEDEEQEVTDAMMWGVKYYGDGMIQAGEISPEMQGLAQTEVQQGLEEEGVPTQTPIAEGVGQAMAPQQPPGLVAGQMGGM